MYGHVRSTLYGLSPCRLSVYGLSLHIASRSIALRAIALQAVGLRSVALRAIASADPCSNAPWKKRKREPTAAYFFNSGKWKIFEEVDREPPCNAGVWFYGKENLSKEDAIEAAKQACKKNGHLGFVVVDAWQTLFYKSHPDVGKPSLKFNNCTNIETHVWMKPVVSPLKPTP